MTRQPKPSSFLGLATQRLRVSWTRWRRSRMRKRLVRMRRQEEALLLLLERHHQKLDDLLTKVERQIQLPVAAVNKPDPVRALVEQAAPEIVPELPLQETEPLLHLTPGSPLEIPEELQPMPPADQEIARLIGLPTQQP